jgi:levansucrase
MLNRNALNAGEGRLPASRWEPPRSALPESLPTTGVFGAEVLEASFAGLFLWDIWPVQLDGGAVASVGPGDLWIVLGAPRSANPDERHNRARMRLVYRTGQEWLDCGDLLPDGFAPGSREWSGSTRLDPESGLVTLWFTAAGRREKTVVDFEQRLFQACGQIDLTGVRPKVRDWSDLCQSVVNDGQHYADLLVDQGVPGRIKGFRDPYWFRDPLDGQGYVLFTGSKPAGTARCEHDGVIGIARANDRDGLAPFTLLPALIDADDTANELERPHVFVHGGLYYLFWSTQGSQFAPGSVMGPTGLYGMVAPALFGPWEPLNGSGLVLANPVAEPRQAYAWQVLPGSLDVVSFVDYWGLAGRDPEQDAALKAKQFGGTIAPMARIELDGKTSRIVAGGA